MNVVGRTFKDASVSVQGASEIHQAAVRRWLKEAVRIQWDYKNIVKGKGKLEKLVTVRGRGDSR